MPQDWEAVDTSGEFRPGHDRPGRGTTRPYAWIEQPRDQKSQRKEMRKQRRKDFAHQEYIEWLKAVQRWIQRTSKLRDHWHDRRWDRLPPEWEYRPWRARKIRRKLLLARKKKLN